MTERPWTETRWTEAEAGRLRLHRIEREGFAARLRRLTNDPRGWRWTWGRDLPLVMSAADLAEIFGEGWRDMDRELAESVPGLPPLTFFSKARQNGKPNLTRIGAALRLVGLPEGGEA